MADQSYSGVVLVLDDGQVLLQRRDSAPTIVNPGRVTLFGGVAEAGESPRQCAVRELLEELELVIEPDQLDQLEDIVKREDDGTLTQCSLFAYQLQSNAVLTQHEGAGLYRATSAEALAGPDISGVAHFAISQLHGPGNVKTNLAETSENSKNETCRRITAPHTINRFVTAGPFPRVAASGRLPPRTTFSRSPYLSTRSGGGMRQLRVVFAGAHPDDIEIGAGGLAYRLVQDGHDVHFLVLTDDPDQAGQRRAEATAAASELGLRADAVLFAGFPDGALPASRASVNAVRRLVEQAAGEVDVVICHTAADSHNDHAQANQLIRAVFRRAVLLFYSIHISAELSKFAPRFYSAVEGEIEAVKEKALDRHASQHERLAKASLAQYEGRLGTPPGLERTEAFEVELQVDADRAAFARIMDYNDSPFTTLWIPLIGKEPLYLLYEVFDGTTPPFSTKVGAATTCGSHSFAAGSRTFRTGRRSSNDSPTAPRPSPCSNPSTCCWPAVRSAISSTVTISAGFAWST